MNREDRNIIQQLIIDLEYTGKADGFVLQEQTGVFCHQKLLPVLEEIIDSSGNNDHKSIDRLDLEISVDGSGDWTHELLKKISEQLKEKLNILSSQQKGSPVTGASTREHFFRTFIYFLKNGYMPWWTTISSKTVFDEAFSEWITVEPEKEMLVTLRELSADPVMQKRITGQLTIENYFALLGFYYPAKKEELQVLKQDILNIMFLLPTSEKQVTAEKFKAIFFPVLTRAGTQADVLALAVKELARVISGFIQTVKLKEDAWAVQSVILKTALEKVIETRKQNLPEKNIDDTKTDEIVKPIAGIKEKFPGKPRTDTETHLSDIAEKDGIYINNAGLVVVAPFLPVFFKKLDLIDENRIIDIDRAVCLVNFIAWGKREMAEFELGLAKVLCGLTMETPVNTITAISEQEEKETEELLASAIDYWSILKDTSAEGLRQTFLQRDGKLSFDNNEWLLQPEQRSYDMLLQHLPWNIAMIKLPWMPHLLKTEWIF